MGTSKRIHQMTVLGDDPIVMLSAPIPATRLALKRAGMTVDDIDLAEVNEAFAPVPLAWMTAAATNALIAAPMWIALNAESSSLLWTHLAAAVTFGMGLMVCYGLSLAVGIDAGRVLSRREIAAMA